MAEKNEDINDEIFLNSETDNDEEFLKEVKKFNKEKKQKETKIKRNRLDGIVSSDDENFVPFGDFDTCLELGYRSNCSVCNHPAAKDSIFIWQESNKNLMLVTRWFAEKHKTRFINRPLESHYANHVEPFISKSMIAHEQKLNNLAKRSMEKTTNDQIGKIRQMHWEYIEENYLDKPKYLKDPASKKEHRELSKQFTELVRSYKDIVMMEWEMLGGGKSEEEQREIMRNFVINSLKKNIEEIKSYPDAYKKLAEKLGLQGPAAIDYVNDGKN